MNRKHAQEFVSVLILATLLCVGVWNLAMKAPGSYAGGGARYLVDSFDYE